MATPAPPQPSPSATPPAPVPEAEKPSTPPLPEPSPGTSPDPDYEPPPPPATEPDGRPSDARRAWERQQLKQPAPDSGGGGFDVKPAHLYYTSALIRDEQFTFHKTATQHVENVHYRQAAGKGEGSDAFAAAYKDVAEKFLDVWARSIQSIGGVAVGLTDTANTYVAADWHSRGMHGPPPRRDPPIGVGKVSYGPVASIKWTGTGDGTDTAFLAGIGEIPDFLADLIKPAVEEGLRLGKTHEITPGARTDELRSIGNAWAAAGKAAQESADHFTQCIRYITDGSNGEWQSAMNGFCQSIWGTTAWGGKWDENGDAVPPKQQGGRDWRTNFRENPATRRPIIEVLRKTGDTMENVFHEAAGAADRGRETTQRLALEATKATVRHFVPDGISWSDLTRLAAVLTFGEVVLVFRSYMDKSGVDKAVEARHQAFHEGAEKLRSLLPELQEAWLSAPTYASEEARAEAFGARALNEFKAEHKWSTPGDADRGIYKVDLASTEWLENSHTVSKHVGLDDNQLAQRLRDDLKKPPRPGTEWPHGQPRVAEASSFKDLETAQRLTQYNIDKNSKELQDWLSDPDRKRGDRTDLFLETTPFGVTGRSIGKEEIKNHPFPAHATQDVYGVETRVLYNPDLDPPITVLTSMPKNKESKG
ncbi:RNase A-like domain-containing protein [Streptomyces sp. enrichment culture]|uniref:RNase A-like domain-containing protein n=1 Tax=Streptomyces sp. enrichment culture TaxID=1795815 RepID=UPI003F57E574